MRNIEAVIFDMDGVLVDAREWHFLALNKALKLFGFEIHKHVHLKVYDGLPTKEKLKILSIEQGLPEGLHAFINEMKQKFTTDMVLESCLPSYQHQYMLSMLKQENYNIAVASNSIRNTVELMMDKSGLRKYLNFMLSNEDVEKAKPAPDIYLKSFEMLNLPPDKCLIVEDNPNGIKAATASGAHVLAINNIDDVNYQNIRRKIQEIC